MPRITKADRENLEIFETIFKKGINAAIKKHKVEEDFICYLLLSFCARRLDDLLGKREVKRLVKDALDSYQETAYRFLPENPLRRKK